MFDLIKNDYVRQLMNKKTEYEWFMIFFTFYKYFIKILKKSWNNTNKICLNINNPKTIYLEPVYTFNKQYLAKRTLFNDFLKLHGFEGKQFFKKKILSNNYYGNIFYITKYKEINDEKKIFEINDDSKTIFRLKHNYYPSDINIFLETQKFFYFNIYSKNIKIIYFIFYINILRNLNKKYI